MREMAILIRCDAGSAIGYGHLVRCLALADELRDRHSCKVLFALKLLQGASLVQEKGYGIYQMPACGGGEYLDEGQWLQEVVVQVNAQALVLDVRSDLALKALKELRASGVLIVTIDDSSVRRLVADFAFYPPVSEVEELDWTGFTGKRFMGWEWVILRPQFAQLQNSVEKNQHGQSELTVLVTMGGSDPGCLTLLALAGLDRLEVDFRTIVVVGRGFIYEAALQQWLSSAKRCYEVKKDVAKMAVLMVEADVAVASFGVTAYELAAMGVPSIYLCFSEEHERSAKTFVDTGIAISLGVGDQVSPEQVGQAVMQVLNYQPDRVAMGSRAKEKVDGFGGQRVANLIFQELNIRSQE